MEIEKIRRGLDTVPYADSIYVLIYTGFRISEFLALKKSDYDPRFNVLIGGSKTAAGKDRVVPVSPKILPIIERWLAAPGGEHLFVGKRGEGITDQMYRVGCFYPALEALGITRKSPHAARHTFATLMKKVNASDIDKQRLIGHASMEMTAYYTHTDYDDLKRITDSL